MSKAPVKNVIRKLNMDEAIDAEKCYKPKSDDVIIMDENGKIIEERMEHEGEEQEEATDEERERRKHRNKKSRSHGHILESVQKELREVRDMIQHIPGVPILWRKRHRPVMLIPPFQMTLYW